MFKKIKISLKTYERLQKLATPFVDDPEAVINRLLDLYEKKIRPPMQSPDPASDSSPRMCSAENPPDLHRTRILNAHFHGYRASKWNELLDVAHIAALDRIGSLEKLLEVTRANVVRGSRMDKGFHYLEDYGFSIQNVDANTAWRHIHTLARKTNCDVVVEFEWRTNEGAVHPGRKGVLSYRPAQSDET